MISGEKIKQIKTECITMCANARAGHVTSALSCSEIVATLYYDVMNISPANPARKDRDRFVMSKNHGSIITYPILADLGFYEKECMSSFLANGSRFGMHTKLDIPGVDFCGGSLGIGIGMACGMAFGAKLSKEDWLTFCLVGDGECYEGSVWEAAMFAGANKLDNLIVIIDRNQLAITDFTEKMLPLGDLKGKWETFGWETREIDGHDLYQIKDALSDVRTRSGSPLCVIANTVKGHGVDFLENQPLWHGKAPVDRQAQNALEQLRGGANGSKPD